MKEDHGTAKLVDADGTTEVISRSPSIESLVHPGTAPTRTADVLLDLLIEAGVEVIFGLPGGAIAPIYDALLDRPDVRVVTTRHEAGAMFAAAGYARATGKLGVVIVTSGPGVLNALTGLASAYCDGLPILLLAGEVPRKIFGKGALQEGSSYHLNVIGIAKHISKLALELSDPNSAPMQLRRAISTALSGRRGPVTVTLPLDVATAAMVKPDVTQEVGISFTIPENTIDRVRHELSAAKRPLLFVGSGVRQGEGPESLRQFAERLQCPVMTTPKAKGVFPEDHPLSLGVYGLGGHPSASEYVTGGVDTLIAVGTSLGDLSTNGWSIQLAPTRELIQVDIDAHQLGRGYPITFGVTAPAALFFSQMLQVMQQAPPSHYGIRYQTDPEQVREGEEKRIAPQRALYELQRLMPEDTIYTCDSGEHFLYAVHYIKVRRPDSFMVMSGLGSMGSGIGAALGTQLALPHRPVVAICGDGGLAMVAGEISTAVAERLPIVFFVMNDQRLGMVELGLTALYGRTGEHTTGPMDVSGLASALGADSIVVKNPGELLAADLMGRLKNSPVVVDVQIDRSIKMAKNGRFEALGSVAKRPRTIH